MFEFTKFSAWLLPPPILSLPSEIILSIGAQLEPPDAITFYDAVKSFNAILTDADREKLKKKETAYVQETGLCQIVWCRRTRRIYRTISYVLTIRLYRNVLISVSLCGRHSVLEGKARIHGRKSCYYKPWPYKNGYKPGRDRGKIV